MYGYCRRRRRFCCVRAAAACSRSSPPSTRKWRPGGSWRRGTREREPTGIYPSCVYRNRIIFAEPVPHHFGGAGAAEHPPFTRKWRRGGSWRRGTGEREPTGIYPFRVYRNRIILAESRIILVGPAPHLLAAQSRIEALRMHCTALVSCIGGLCDAFLLSS
jgi:hypothetical protein